eukprot:942789-Pyramimonas_sp.AAC.1
MDGQRSYDRNTIQFIEEKHRKTVPGSQCSDRTIRRRANRMIESSGARIFSTAFANTTPNCAGAGGHFYLRALGGSVCANSSWCG